MWKSNDSGVRAKFDFHAGSAGAGRSCPCTTAPSPASGACGRRTPWTCSGASTTATTRRSRATGAATRGASGKLVRADASVVMFRVHTIQAQGSGYSRLVGLLSLLRPSITTFLKRASRAGSLSLCFNNQFAKVAAPHKRGQIGHQPRRPAPRPSHQTASYALSDARRWRPDGGLLLVANHGQWRTILCRGPAARAEARPYVSRRQRRPARFSPCAVAAGHPRAEARGTAAPVRDAQRQDTTRRRLESRPGVTSKCRRSRPCGPSSFPALLPARRWGGTTKAVDVTATRSRSSTSTMFVGELVALPYLLSKKSATTTPSTSSSATTSAKHGRVRAATAGLSSTRGPISDMMAAGTTICGHGEPVPCWSRTTGARRR